MMNTVLPPNYQSFIEGLKAHIHQARMKAALAVNKELLLMYWNIGNKIHQLLPNLILG